MSTYVLPFTYLGPISYYMYRVNYHCEIEIHNHYVKQTYANRCLIASPNGPIALSIPVEKPSEPTAVRDIKLSNHTHWKSLHWRSIESAYNSSPFFEYYKDDLQKIYQKNHIYLFDFNQELEACILELLDYEAIEPLYTKSYESFLKNNEIDIRNKIEPKKKGLYLHNKLKVPYYQVFENKLGFLPDLSIIDLLFNLGNEARLYLNLNT